MSIAHPRRVGVLVAVLATLIGTATASAACPDGSEFAAPVTFTATSTEADHLALISLDTQSPIAAGRMRADAGDLRFVTDLDGACTPIPAWVESGVNSATTRIWLRLAVPAGTSTVYAVSGSPALNDQTTPDDVFGAGVRSIHTYREGAGATVEDGVDATNSFTRSGATPPAWGTGFRPGVGALGDFTGGRATAPSGGPQLGTGDFTILAAFRPTAQDLNNVNTRIYNSYTTDGAPGWRLKMFGSGGYTLLTNSGNNYCQERSTGGLTPDTWHMITAVRVSGVGHTLYQDGGTPVSRCAGDNRNVSSTGPLEVGSSNGTLPLRGQIGFDAIYDRALGAAEVSALYAALMPATVPTSSAAAFEPLDGLRVLAVSVDEDAGSATVTVRRADPAGAPVTADYATQDDSAGPTDYTTTSGTLSFPTGVAERTFTVPITNDDVAEPTESFTIALTNITGGLTQESSGPVTIHDEDGALAVADTSKREGDGPMTFTVTRTGSTDRAATVDYATADGTAGAADYTPVSGTLTFPIGSTSQSFDVPVTDDTLVEGDEDLTVTLSGATGPGAVVDATATGIIRDDDGTLSIGDVAVDEDGGSATLTVSRAGQPTGTVTVDYATATGSASATDFTATAGTLTFGPGVTTQTIAVAIADDSVVEGDESFTVVLSNAAGSASIARGTGTISIGDQDSELAISDASAREGDGPARFTISRTGSDRRAVTVSYATSAGTAGTGDYTTTSGTAVLPAGTSSVTVDVPVIDDALAEDDEQFTMTLSGGTGPATISDATATGTISDDDGTLDVADVSVAEDAGTATVTVQRSGPPTRAVTVDYATSPGTATSADFDATSGTLSIPAGATKATVVIPVTDDSAVEPEESFSLSLSNPSGSASIGSGTATVTIRDEDSALSLVDVAGSEGGGSLTFRVLRRGALTRAVTVGYTVTAGTADAGDFTPVSGTLSFPSGSSSQVIVVPVTADTTDEPDETIRATLGATTGPATVEGGPATGTIIDDDATITPGPWPGPTPGPGPALVGAPPSLRVVSPASGALLRGVIRFVVDVGDADGIQSVRFLNDGATTCDQRAAPYDCIFIPKDEDVGSNQFVVVATDRTGQTTTRTLTVNVPRFRPRLLSMYLSPSRTGAAPHGTLSRPPAVGTLRGCRAGIVRVTFRAGGRTVAAADARVNGRTCRYAVKRVPWAVFGVHRRLTVRARYEGNPVLLPLIGPRRTLTVP